MYQYQAKITGVYDGDTVTADIDLGFGVVLHSQKLRLLGINAPELRGETKLRGMTSRDWLIGKILGRDVLICTRKDKRTETDKHDSFGRWLAEIFIDGASVNQQLVELGLAVPYMVEKP
jgi:micrococcal nuclease